MKLIMERFNKFLVEGHDVRKVSKVVMIDKNDKVLILRRSGRIISEESPWEWDLPGGHAEQDEALESLGRNEFGSWRSHKNLYRRLYNLFCIL